MITLAVANHKGGVFKTTTVMNLGAALAGMNKRVLLVDLDSSADLTYTAGIDLTDDDSTVFDVLTGQTTASDAAWTLTDDRGCSYDVLPTDSALLGLAEALKDVQNPQYRLRDALRAAENDYDYVLIDTPPAADMASIQAMIAADGIIAPAQPHALSVTALTSLAATANEVHTLNPGLKIDGILLTGYNPRSNHHADIREAISKAMPGTLFETTISSAVGVAEAASARTNIFEYAMHNPGRKKMKPLDQYKSLAEEVIRRKEQVNNGDS